MINLFLSHRDTDVNVKNRYGRTVLHYASMGLKCKECVKELLLDARIDIMIRCNSGRTARDMTIYFEHQIIANVLKRVLHTSLLRIPNSMLIHDIIRMIIEEYT